MLPEQQFTGVVEFGILLRAQSEEFDQPEKELFNDILNDRGNVEFSLVSEDDDHSLGTPRFRHNLDEEDLEGPDEVAQRVAQPGEVVEEI